MSLIRYAEPENGVAVATLNRPAEMNALNSAVLQELNRLLDDIDLSKTFCLIITGSGDKAFAAGADISEMQNMNAEAAAAFAKTGCGIFRKLEKLPIPVIAAVNGYALGGGCELSLSCDIRICSENAVFGQPEVRLGVTPGFGGTQRLMRLVGAGMAKQMIYTGMSIHAGDAMRIGLVNAVYPQEMLMEEATRLATRIAQNAPIAVRYAKEVMDCGTALDIEQATALESNLFGACFSTEDQKTGMHAFLRKEKHITFQNR